MIEDQEYVFPKIKMETNIFIEHIIGWAEKNPKASINLGCDSGVTNAQSVKNTKELI